MYFLPLIFAFIFIGLMVVILILSKRIDRLERNEKKICSDNNLVDKEILDFKEFISDCKEVLNILSQVNSELAFKIGYKIDLVKEVESKFGEDKIVEKAKLIKINSRRSRN